MLTDIKAGLLIVLFTAKVEDRPKLTKQF